MFRFFNKKKNKKYFCNAPFKALSIDISGLVSPCCYMHAQTEFISKSSNLYPNKKLSDIFAGDKFNFFRTCFKNNIIPKECAICKQEFDTQNSTPHKIRMYEKYKTNPKYPVIIELTIDNTCNLECVMCSSIHSSVIAKKNNININNDIIKDTFLNEIDAFLPHLKEIIISGGEPFLSRTYIELIKKILHVNPSCNFYINTNGTILTNEIKQLLEKGNFSFNISLDSVNKNTYEKIRKGAHFETVMQNLDYLSAYSKRKNTCINVMVCPLILNYKEFPEILNFCNKNSFNLNFVHVFNAHEVALTSAEDVILEDAIRVYSKSAFENENFIQTENLQKYTTWIGFIRKSLIFNAWKKNFLKNIKADKDKFDNDYNLLLKKVRLFIEEQNLENSDDLFNNWQLKFNQLYKELPDYFRSEIFYGPVFNFPIELLYSYFELLPIEELKNYLITFCNEIIKDHQIKSLEKKII